MYTNSGAIDLKVMSTFFLCGDYREELTHLKEYMYINYSNPLNEKSKKIQNNL